MPHHQERGANALARGPAKTADIEGARRATVEARPDEARARQAIGDVETACESIRKDIDELKRIVYIERT
jgi:hypothetical protein